jgi:hypothetical protein
MLSAFCDQKVEFLLVGAYALAAHGYPRATGDIDLWVQCSNENSQRIWHALKQFGAPVFDLTIEDLQTPGIIFQIGVPPCRIDIITKIDGVEFEPAWENRKRIEIEGLSIHVIGKHDLLKNKKASGRPKDLADVAWLEEKK